MSRMSSRKHFCTFNNKIHKGFYNDGDALQSLRNIRYTEFLKLPTNDEFPYESADSLLCGSCNHFAVALHKTMGYPIYVIESKGKKGFHAFCEISRNKQRYFADARGITSSFDEFMEIAKIFVADEYIIRPAESDDINDWEANSDFNEEAYAFSEAIINKYRECYSLDD